MILDLERFVKNGQPAWTELEEQLQRLERNPDRTLSVEELQRLHALYQRVSADLLRVQPLLSEAALRKYLENLVSRAYSEIHGTTKKEQVHLLRWFLHGFPSAVRRHGVALALSTALFLGGSVIGGWLFAVNPENKRFLIPFSHLAESPAERVAREESDGGIDVTNYRGRFSGQLMVNNIRVSLTTVALGATFGIGSALVLFFNGVGLGVVGVDYVREGQATFLFGWLLPHGSIELPAIILAGQAAFVLASAIIGYGSRQRRSDRLRQAAPTVLSLIGGVAVMLVWAGIVEAFFSQYHEPVVPYAVKIGFGLVELFGLAAFLWWGGRKEEAAALAATSFAGKRR